MRPILKTLTLGCGVIALLFAALLLWVGFQIHQVNRPVELTEHHPFRSPARKSRYLELYGAWAARWPGPSESLMVETSWGQTFVRVNGPAEGPPLVLLPGANAPSLMWEHNIEAFAESQRVYAVDNLFDFGRSVYTRIATTPADYVSWLDELFDGLGLRADVRLVGLSYGGWVASQYALEHPERIERLVLIAPAATVLPFSGGFVKRGLLCLIPHKYFVGNMVRWALADAAAGTEEQRRFVDEAADAAWLGLRSFRPRQQVHPTVLTDEELRALEPPTLYLVGENEVIYAGTAADAVARLNEVAPDIVTVIVPGCGHDLTLVKPDLVNRLVLEFLAGDPSTG